MTRRICSESGSAPEQQAFDGNDLEVSQLRCKEKYGSEMSLALSSMVTGDIRLELSRRSPEQSLSCFGPST